MRAPRTSASRATTGDPLAAAFAAAQEVYKVGLLAWINARRAALDATPVSWPAVGATPRDEIWRDGPARLLRYRAAPADRARPPILLVASLINRPYVLDLLPERSVVARLLDGGLDVFLLDWGTPRPEDARRGLDVYALELLPAAAAVVARTAGATPHLLGYCMGGTLALAAVAIGALAANGLVALAAPISMRDDGLLSLWCRTPGFEPAELARAWGNIPPHVLQPAFKMLDPIGLATKLIHLEEKLRDDDFVRFFLAMETWLEDSVAFPGRAFAEWVGLYRSDALAAGTWALAGRRIDLSRVTCPVWNVVAEGDYITPPASSEPLGRLLGGPCELIRMKGGHIGLSTGGEAQRRLWPDLAKRILMQSHHDMARPHQKKTRSQKTNVRSHKKGSRR